MSSSILQAEKMSVPSWLVAQDHEGWFLNKNTSDKEQCLCKKIGLEIIDADDEELFEPLRSEIN